MRSILIFMLALVVGVPAFAKSVRVKGYVTKSGKYVAPHYRSSPDRSRMNNWSTQGNVNPYTGKVGTRNPYPAYNPYRYSSPTPSYVPRPRSYYKPNNGYTAPSYGYTPPNYGYALPAYTGAKSNKGHASRRDIQRASSNSKVSRAAEPTGPVHLSSGVVKVPARTASGFCLQTPYDYVGTGSYNYPAVTSAMPRCDAMQM